MFFVFWGVFLDETHDYLDLGCKIISEVWFVFNGSGLILLSDTKFLYLSFHIVWIFI